ncbi:MAG: TlpA family protein disulfide reductase [Acidobacteria bacterium]|nr:TlpA family protein disulfide reductase [Acidobacteriota bacterium]
MSKFRRTPVLLTSSILLLATVPLLGWGCSSGSTTAGGTKQAGASGAASATPADSSGDDAQLVKLDFSLPKATGDGSVDLKQFDGTIRVVDFWATWCPPCRMAIPGLNQLYRKYKDQGVSVVGISVDENPKALVGFDKEAHIEYASLLTSEQAEKAFGGIVGLPTTFVVDRQGKVFKSYVGEVPRDELEADIQTLLAVR